jgi:hypothetical protein
VRSIPPVPLEQARSNYSVLPLLSVLSVLSALSAPQVLPAQAITAAGRVLRADSTPVGGMRVVLHQIGRAAQGPLDSTSSDSRGRFRFAFTHDTTALYLLSARFAGIEYFSPPVHTNPERPDTALRIVVYDTSSIAPVVLQARHLVVTRPGDDGSRSVLDLLVLRNDGQLTRIAPDTVRPTWSGPLPAGTMGLELGEGDISPDAVSRRGQSLVITAPLSPGEKQITVQYTVPAGRKVMELAFTQPVASVNVLAEEKDVLVGGGTLAFADSQVIQGRSFRRWTGDVPVGGTVRVTLPASRPGPQWLLGALVGLVVLALGGGGWYFLSRRKAGLPAAAPQDLVNAIAALDARYLDREGETAAHEWISYQQERARLKAELESTLADGWRSR